MEQKYDRWVNIDSVV